MNSDRNEEAVYDLISLFEISGGASSVDEFLPPELVTVIPARFQGAVTAERLGRIIDESISALTDPAARDKARGRWHSAKVAMLSDDDPAIRSAAAASITDDDLDDPVVVARFRDEVEHGDSEVVISFAEAFAENVDDGRRDDLATVLTEFAETLSAPELTMVLQVLGTLYARARAMVPRDVLTRLASVAARSLIWEPEPVTLCAWSIEAHGQYDVLAEWLRSPDADMASFATWIASKLADKLNPADRASLSEALRQIVSRWSGSAENPRAAIAAQRAKELLALIDDFR